MNAELQLLFKMAVRKYMSDRELLRQIWSQTPRDPWANHIRRTMPMVAPCAEMALRARHAAARAAQ